MTNSNNKACLCAMTYVIVMLSSILPAVGQNHDSGRGKPKIHIRGIAPRDFSMATYLPLSRINQDLSGNWESSNYSVEKYYANPPFCSSSKILTIKGSYIFFWEESGKMIKTLNNNTTIKAYSISIDGRIMICLGEDGIVHVWNLRNDEIVKSFKAFSKGPVAISPDGNAILMTVKDSTNQQQVSCQVVDVLSGKIEFSRTLIGDSISHATFSETRSDVLFSSYGGQIEIWNWKEKKQFFHYQFDPGQRYSGYCRAYFLAGSEHILITGQKRKKWETSIWNVPSKRRVNKTDSYFRGFTEGNGGKDIILFTENSVFQWQDSAGSKIRSVTLPTSDSTKYDDIVAVAPITADKDIRYIITKKGNCYRLNERTWTYEYQYKLGIPSYADIQHFRLSPDKSQVLIFVFNFFEGSCWFTIDLKDDAGKPLIDTVRINRFKNVITNLEETKLFLGGIRTTEVWDLVTGRKISSFPGLQPQIAISHDFRLIADQTGNCHDLDRNTIISKIDHPSPPEYIIFSPDNKSILVRYRTDTLRLWNAYSGQLEKQILLGPPIYNDRSKKRSLQEIDKSFAHLGDEDPAEYLVENFSENIAFSPDGRWIAVANKHDVNLYTGSGEFVRTMVAKDSDAIAPVTSIAFSENVQRLFAGYKYGMLFEWDLEGNELSRRNMEPDRNMYSESDEIKKIQPFGNGNDVFALASNGKLFSTLHNSNGDITVKPGHRQRSVLTFDSQSSSSVLIRAVNDFSMSNDRSYLATCGDDTDVHLWNLRTGEIDKIPVSSVVKHVYISPSNKFIFAVREDGAILVWNAALKKQACTLFSFSNGHWMTMSSDNKFDAGDPEQLSEISWIFPDEPLTALAPEIFMRDYYSPGILAKSMYSKDTITNGNTGDMSRLNRDRASIIDIQVDTGRIAGTVNVKVLFRDVNTSCKIGKSNSEVQSDVYDVRLFRDDRLIAELPTGANEFADNSSKETNLFEQKPLSEWRRVMKLESGDTIVAEFNNISITADRQSIKFSAYAFNEDRIKTDTKYKYYSPPKMQPRKHSKLFVLTIGVNNTQNGWNLSTPANDARAYASELPLLCERSFSEIIPIRLISSNNLKFNGEIPATKENIRYLLQWLSHGAANTMENHSSVSDSLRSWVQQIQPPDPTDVVLIAFSGHGFATSQSLFYLVPTNTGFSPPPRAGDLNNYLNGVTSNMPEATALFVKKCISSGELASWLSDIDVSRLFFIIDACYSSAVVGDENIFRPGPMGDAGFGQFAYDKKMVILTATQARNVSIGNLNEPLGLLASSLLNSNASTYFNQNIDFDNWLRKSLKEVPELYRRYFPGLDKKFNQVPQLYNFSKK